ncbi:MAG: hypothetical protein IPK82_35430 [Polyangiaceae bacterium]|nr:hypothetical protein [Polyangiaceae bacterium]
MHQPFYCEENIYHFCDHPFVKDRDRFVLVIGGNQGGFFMWRQRAGMGRRGPIFWDYHVILLTRDPWMVWDLDTTLPLPSAALNYLAASFYYNLDEQWLPIFRMLTATEYKNKLVTDRSHMRKPDGRFERPEPPWPLLTPPEMGTNLARFVNMKDPFLGQILSLRDLTHLCEQTA